MREFLFLLRLGRQNKAYRRELGREEEKRLGGFTWYRSLKRALALAYRWKNPYMVARSARKRLKVPEDDLIFGETPFLTAYDLLMELGVDQADHVVECGGGRGIFSLVAVSALGCRATVLEIIPTFVKKTREVASSLGLERVTVKQADMLSAELPEGTVYYLTGTTFSEETWRKLQRQMAAAPEGARAISLSVPLDSKAWQLEKSLTLPFSWGENSVHLHVRK